MARKTDVHRLAAFLESQGVGKGDFVAVFMTNSPEMIVTILALSKLCAVAGLININLRGELRSIFVVTFFEPPLISPAPGNAGVNMCQMTRLNIAWTSQRQKRSFRLPI
jgi:acyl-CoA synthetase (AMP-forming)/AMP-acid ligase II